MAVSATRRQNLRALWVPRKSRCHSGVNRSQNMKMLQTCSEFDLPDETRWASHGSLPFKCPGRVSTPHGVAPNGFKVFSASVQLAVSSVRVTLSMVAFLHPPQVLTLLSPSRLDHELDQTRRATEERIRYARL